ncbi:MAG: alkaline phosphatase, partial [Pseudomonadota bacterium]
MISDGAGFNGWLAADYYQGLAGQQSYQTARPDGTTPVVFGMAHDSITFIDADGDPLPSGFDPASAAGAVMMGYDPRTRWQALENGFTNDFVVVPGDEDLEYTSYTDSAAAGTAMHSGRATSNGRLNLDWSGEVEFETIAEIAMAQGKAAGAVSSVQLTHATPASVIANNVSRNNYVEIANQMLGSDLTVMMGAGHPFYDQSGNAVEPEEDRPFRFLGGRETVAQLTSESGMNGLTFIDAVADFEALAAGDNLPERVVGIARSNGTLQANREGLPEGDTLSGMAFNPDVPNLATMSLAALNVLNQDEDGFFVSIEGGAVDWMGHGNDMPRYIEEQVDFNEAVDAVIEWVEANSSWDETLLIVTSDHECGGIWGEGTYTNSVGGPVATDLSDEATAEANYNPTADTFNEFLAVQDNGAGNLPGYQFASGNHTND